MSERLETTFSGKKLIYETKKVAKQADGAIWAQYGDTVLLVATCYDKLNERDVDFFPLTIEYREKAAAAGKIPGGFFKRETRPANHEILAGRIVDRSLRPLFPENYKSEVQILISVMSYDQEAPPDVLAVNAASLALLISPIPFTTPVGAVSVRLFEENGEFVLNPDDKSEENAILDLFVSGTKERVLMIEAGGKEISEDKFMEAIKFAHAAVKKQIEIQEEFARKMTVQKVAVPEPKIDENLRKEVYDFFRPLCDKALRTVDKLERGNAVMAAMDESYKHFIAKSGIAEDNKAEIDKFKKTIKPVFEAVEYDVVREMIFNEKIRVDGRKLTEIRPLAAEVGLLPRVHGSALFTRGQTQSLAMITLGTKKDAQIIESLSDETLQRFMLHYNFPPYSTGEVKPLRGIGRREIGHGALAEKALANVMPTDEQFPYTVRVISEILESNGSSSMASICAGSLALMDAGVPIKSPVAGIAMGLITLGDQWEVLTDIAGIEDHCGDMDFKVGGTRQGMTAVQLDVKNTGLTYEMIDRTIRNARDARMHILGVMTAAIDTPRADISKYAPRIISFMIDPEKIREVIGSGGKVIRAIVEASGAEIDIEDSGKVSVISSDLEKSQKAIKMINDIIKEVEVGEVYTGKVTRLMNFGAFVEVLPNKEGLVHISELDWKRTEKVEDVCKIGDEMTVKVIEIDSMGRVNLSRRVLLPRDPSIPDRPVNMSGDRPPRRDGDRPRGDRPPRREGGGRDRR